MIHMGAMITANAMYLDPNGVSLQPSKDFQIIRGESREKSG